MITARYLSHGDDRPVNIHLCKDRTLSYRRRGSGEPVFNDVAVPVLSVASEEEAEELMLLVGTNQYGPHPHPRYKHPKWLKLFNGVADGKRHLEPEDVPEAEDYLWKAYQRLLEIRK